MPPTKFMGTMGLGERDSFMDVVFSAHTGFKNGASFLDIVCGSMIGSETRVRFWGYSAASIPRIRQEQKSRIRENWLRIDDFVAEVQSGAARCRSQKDD